MSHVSLLPADAVEGAGLPLDDVDVIIKEARFALWNYNGTQAEGPALRVIFVDGEEKSHEQYFSAGKIEKSVPSDDGKKLLPVSDASPKGLNKSTKAFTFLASLFNADPAVGTLLADGDVSKLDGLRAHVIAAADKNDKGETIKNAKGLEDHRVAWSDPEGSCGRQEGGGGRSGGSGSSGSGGQCGTGREGCRDRPRSPRGAGRHCGAAEAEPAGVQGGREGIQQAGHRDAGVSGGLPEGELRLRRHERQHGGVSSRQPVASSSVLPSA
jgi:hypothetical protein